MAIYEMRNLLYIIIYQLLPAKITIFLGVNSVKIVLAFKYSLDIENQDTPFLSPFRQAQGPERTEGQSRQDR